MKSPRLANVALLSLSVAISLTAFEMAARAYFDKDMFVMRDWRADTVKLKTGSIYDPFLGWKLASGIRSDGFNTIGQGIRKNSAKDETVEEGAILAVGDSFTAGSEVTDSQTWPAQLERLRGQRVLNGGVGSYGVDQTILRIESLLPILKPKTVLVGILVDDIARTQYAKYGQPKPYFSEQKGEFVQMNNPVPHTAVEPARKISFGTTRNIIARSFVAHLLLMKFAAPWWLDGIAATEFGYQKANNDPIAVSCFLLSRLKRELVSRGIRAAVVMQYGGWIFARGDKRPRDAVEVLACAKRQGYEIVDEYDALKRVAERSIPELMSHYVMHKDNTVYGHMSETGNRLVAGLISERLRGEKSRESAPPIEKPEYIVGDGLNRLRGVGENVFHGANVEVGSSSASGPISSFAPVVKLKATGRQVEHYAALDWVGEQPGHYLFSTAAKLEPTAAVRLQLLDSKSNGVIFDFSPSNQEPRVIRIGGSHAIRYDVSDEGDDWYRIVVTAKLDAAQGRAIIQFIKPDGATIVDEDIPDMYIQAPMVEFGRYSTGFCIPHMCSINSFYKYSEKNIKRLFRKMMSKF